MDVIKYQDSCHVWCTYKESWRVVKNLMREWRSLLYSCEPDISCKDEEIVMVFDKSSNFYWSYQWIHSYQKDVKDRDFCMRNSLEEWIELKSCIIQYLMWQRITWSDHHRSFLKANHK